MKRNINNIDKIIRVIIAIAIAVLYYYNYITGTLGVVLMVAAIVLLITVFINFCPIYKALGISSFKTKK